MVRKKGEEMSSPFFCCSKIHNPPLSPFRKGGLGSPPFTKRRMGGIMEVIPRLVDLILHVGESEAIFSFGIIPRAHDVKD